MFNERQLSSYPTGGRIINFASQPSSSAHSPITHLTASQLSFSLWSLARTPMFELFLMNLFDRFKLPKLTIFHLQSFQTFPAPILCYQWIGDRQRRPAQLSIDSGESPPVTPNCFAHTSLQTIFQPSAHFVIVLLSSSINTSFSVYFSLRFSLSTSFQSYLRLPYLCI